MSNKFKYAALGAAFALTVGAAPALAQDAPAAPEAMGGDLAYEGEISFWNTQRDFEFQVVQSLIDAWQEANPGVSVKHDAVPFDTALNNYQNAAPAGTAPDIFRSDVSWNIGLANEGFLLDLTELVDYSDFITPPVEAASWLGGVYGVPSVTDTLGLQCNADLLAEAGLDAAPATWDELVAAGVTFADLDNQQYGMYTRGDSYWAQPWIWSWGGELYTVDADGNVTVLINSPESAAGLDYLKDSVLGTIAPATWDFANDYTNMTEGFKAGTIMCVMNGPWQVADHLAGSAFADPSNLVIAPLPAGVDGSVGSPLGGHNLVVYALVADDPDKQAAVLSLLDYMNSTEAQVFLAENLGLIPTRNSALSDEAVISNDVVSAWIPVMDTAINRGGHPGSATQYDAFNREYQAFLVGEKTAEEALASLETAWNELFGS